MARRDAIDVWVADLDAYARANPIVAAAPEPDSTLRREASELPVHTVLSTQELTRAVAIRGELARERFVAARSILRTLLGEVLQLASADVAFELAEHGKPRLAPIGEHRPPICFSVSHSGPLAVYAIAVAREVGVDVELLRARSRSRDEVAIARRMLGERAAEELDELAGEERHRAFLRLWTDYEARVKCLGIGIGLGADSANAAALRSLWAGELPVGEDTAIGAIAAQGGPAELVVRRFGRSEACNPGA